jgi:hypothetical protein
MVEEVFVNENGHMRAKVKNLHNVIRLLGNLEETTQSQIINTVAEHLSTAILKDPMENRFTDVSQRVETALFGSEISLDNAAILKEAIVSAEARALQEHYQQLQVLRGAI